MPKPPAPNNYKTLLKNVAQELANLETILKNRSVEAARNIGRHIHVYLLEGQDRAKYGANVLSKLAKDVKRDVSTLQRALRFYRAYPIQAAPPKLTLEHFRSLITIEDDKERKKAEQKAIHNNWSTKQLHEYVSTKHKLEAAKNSTKPIPQLPVTRGRLHTYQIVPANKPLKKIAPLVLDLGFRLQHIPPERSRVKEGEIFELEFQQGVAVGLKKIEAAKNELFTYEAYIEKVIDGDTLLASFYFEGRFLIAQKLRLAGIDAPEVETPEGKKAKRFVESRLKDCEFVIVKTTKDRTDRFDRYLADIFYAPGVADSAQVAREGIYLNQELLNERLAVLYMPLQNPG